MSKNDSTTCPECSREIGDEISFEKHWCSHLLSDYRETDRIWYKIDPEMLHKKDERYGSND